MQIISHRGYWVNPCEKNKFEAFRRSLDLGFGLETDIRDCGYELVVSHDVPDSDCIPLTNLLELSFREWIILNRCGSMVKIDERCLDFKFTKEIVLN